MKIFLMTIFFACCLFSLHSAPQAELWTYWDVRDNSDTRSINHSDFQNFVDSYRIKKSDSETAKVKYASVSERDKVFLLDYIDDMSRLNILEYNSKEQFAFWVNLYNAVTINLILENYPVKSIRKIDKPWSQALISINGKNLSLNDIEHRILRPIWQDPRIHFVVNCASLGCPDLPANVLTADNQEKVLEMSTKLFLNHKRAVSYERGTLKLSSLFDWYADDFGNNTAEILDFISRFYDFTEIETQSGKSKYNLKIRYDYDWDLNE